jgi:hypothetical protein
VRVVSAAAAVVAASYLSALLVGAGVLRLAALLGRRVCESRTRPSDPSLAGQLDRPEGPAVNLETAGPEFASGTDLLADLIVLRHGPDIPPELYAQMVEGRWWNMAGHHFHYLRCPLADGSIAVATPSGEFEMDSRGRIAEVWELACDLPDAL